MKSTEPMELRLKRVDMHEYFLEKIEKAMKRGDYIAASWLIYACMENRYFRTLEKYKSGCKYCRSKSKCNKKPKNELALSTKVKCVKRLYQNGVTCIVNSFQSDLFDKTIRWIDDRNNLMHELLALETYQNSDGEFKKIAEQGNLLLKRTYISCTKFRELFYAEGYEFKFPESAMEDCPCKKREEDKNAKTNL